MSFDKLDNRMYDMVCCMGNCTQTCDQAHVICPNN